MSRMQHIRTPTGVLALIQPTAEKLLAEGVISGTLDGDLHAADAATVKAAIMAASVCDFCSTPGATRLYDVPDFGVTSAAPDSYAATRFTGGWMACDVCAGLIDAGKRAALVDRAVETMAFPKFTRRALDELLANFWRGMDQRVQAVGIGAAIGDFIEDRLSLPVSPAGPRGDRIAHAMRATGLARPEVDALLDGTMSRAVIDKLIAFDRRAGGNDRRLAALLAGAVPPPLPPLSPHWQQALDAKFTMLGNLEGLLAGIRARTIAFKDPTDLADRDAVTALMRRTDAVRAVQDLEYDKDVKFLRAAEAFSFGADPIVAIAEAAALLPRDAPLSSVEVPTGAGWFWFSTPLPVAMTTSMPANVTHALLWGWDHVGDAQTVAMRFSGFVLDEKGAPSPATAWHWPLRMTFDEMLAFNRDLYRRDYFGPARRRVPVDVQLGEDGTIDAIAALSRFFLAACVWFKQKILVSAPGHVERHARKRIEREHKLADPPSVRVIALRASLQQRGAHAPTDGAIGPSRKLHVRFVVVGHPRLQRCGPGRADVKLIWIAPYPKGPADAPFRSREKVYAVIR